MHLVHLQELGQYAYQSAPDVDIESISDSNAIEIYFVGAITIRCQSDTETG